ncbi:hypothetical protein [Haloglomus litoreum]|uniref:hypothetical protein n=1 Tax=Haloglomus litoreum TaxID=3034026 RepID=UPI0023E7FC6A|nr:hypothetical protein [Haloglomus sp. DT116]
MSAHVSGCGRGGEDFAAEVGGGDPEDSDSSADFHRQAEEDGGEAVPDGRE